MTPEGLSMGLSALVTDSFEYQRRMVVRGASSVFNQCSQSRGGGWDEFKDQVLYKMDLLQDMPLVPRSFNFDLWCYRTEEEARIGAKLYELWHRVSGWQGVADYHQAAILWRLPRLPAEYRTLKKAEDFFWAETVRMERRLRARCGILAQWHQPEAEGINTYEQVNRWLVLPHWFKDWEVAQGFWAELGPPLAYIGSALMADRTSGWWVVVLTNWVVEVWVYEIWEAFDTWRLWWLPPRVRDAVEVLDLSPVLGCDGIQDAKSAVRLLRETDWDAVPIENQSRMRIVKNWSSGRDGSAGDFIWVDLYEWRVVPPRVAKGARAKPYDANTPFPRARGLNFRRAMDAEPRKFDHHADTVSSFGTFSALVTGLCPKGQKYKAASVPIPSTASSMARPASVEPIQVGSAGLPGPDVVSMEESPPRGPGIGSGSSVPEIVTVSNTDPEVDGVTPVPEEPTARPSRRLRRSFRVFDGRGSYPPRVVRKSAEPLAKVDTTERSSESASLGGSPPRRRPRSPQNNENRAPPGDPESVSSWEVLFEAATTAFPDQNRGVSVERDLPSASVVPEAGPAVGSSSHCVDYASSLSSPGSPPEADDVVTTLDPKGCRPEGQWSKSPTPPWEAVPPEEPVLELPEANVECPQGEAVTARGPEGQDVTSLDADSGSATVGIEEVDASVVPVEGDRTTEQVTFSDSEIGTLHRFLGRLVPVPEEGFGSTEPELARQLHELLGDHVDSMVRDRFSRSGFDPSRP